MADESLRSALEERPNPLVRLKVPLWVVLAVSLVLILGFVFIYAGKSSVGVGPGVNGAERVDVQVCYSDQVARDKKLDILKAEDEFEAGLRELGAKEAAVRIDRIPNCAVAPPTSPVTTTTRR